MGRNSGSQIQFQLTKSSGNNYIVTWYCQQHVKWDQISNVGRVNATATLKTHLETDHGNVKQ